MTVANPVRPSTLARTVLVNVPAVLPAVNIPVVRLIVPPLATTAHVGVIATTFPLASLPTAVNCWVIPTPTDDGVGETVIDASGPAVTMTVATLVLPLLVAITVFVYVDGVVPAVNRPVALIVPPPATTDQVGVTFTDLPDASLPVAVNCCVPLMARVFGFGDTESVISVPGAVMPWTSQATARSPAMATPDRTCVTRTRRVSVAQPRPFIKLFIELLVNCCVETRRGTGAPRFVENFDGRPRATCIAAGERNASLQRETLRLAISLASSTPRRARTSDWAEME